MSSTATTYRRADDSDHIKNPAAPESVSLGRTQAPSSAHCRVDGPRHSDRARAGRLPCRAYGRESEFSWDVAASMREWVKQRRSEMEREEHHVSVARSAGRWCLSFCVTTITRPVTFAGKAGNPGNSTPPDSWSATPKATTCERNRVDACGGNGFTTRRTDLGALGNRTPAYGWGGNESRSLVECCWRAC